MNFSLIGSFQTRKVEYCIMGMYRVAKKERDKLRSVDSGVVSYGVYEEMNRR